MVNTRIGLAVLATSSLVAAGAGGFLATRYNATPAAQTAVAGPAESGKEAVKPPDAAKPVEETEAVMDEGVAAPETATTSAPTSAPSTSSPRPALESSIRSRVLTAHAASGVAPTRSTAHAAAAKVPARFPRRSPPKTRLG